MAEGRCLIVGGCGYIGARLAEAWAAEWDVTVTRRSTSAARDAWLARAGVRAIPFDSATMSALPVAGEFDLVVNLAMPGTAEAARDPDAAHKARVTAAACCELLRQGRARRLIHASSFHVYGRSRARYHEDDTPEPVHPYGAIHLECERVALAHEHACVIRPSNMVAAPAHPDLGDQLRLIFLDLCRQARTGKLQLHNDGASHRDFLPFDDVLSALRLLASSPVSGVFNLARGASMRLDEVARLIASAAEGDVEVGFGTGTDAFRAPFVVDTARLRALGWAPQAALQDEARRAIRFFA